MNRKSYYENKKEYFQAYARKYYQEHKDKITKQIFNNKLNKISNRIVTKCKKCNQEFYIVPSQFNKYKDHFCSGKCRGLDQRKQVEKKCIACKQKILIKNYRSKQKKHFCGQVCLKKHQESLKQEISCLGCQKKFKKYKKQIVRTNKNFCSLKCFNQFIILQPNFRPNRISKLEKYISKKLKEQYPNLLIEFNQRLAIGSELDIYIPSLQLAIEINGPVHYKPIYGDDILTKIQKRDKEKQRLCLKNKIVLKTINTSNQGTFSPKSSQLYLDNILSFIDCVN